VADQWTVMVVSADLEQRRNIARILANQGFDPFCAATVRECREALRNQDIALVFSGKYFSDGDYRDILATTTESQNKDRPRVVLMSEAMRPEEYQSVRRTGVFDIINMPCRPTNIEWTIILAKRDERNRMKQMVPLPAANYPQHKAAAAG